VFFAREPRRKRALWALEDDIAGRHGPSRPAPGRLRPLSARLDRPYEHTVREGADQRPDRAAHPVFTVDRRAQRRESAPMRHSLGRRLALLVTATSCAVLLVPAAARADRAPSRGERREIVRASRAEAAPTQFVKTSGVRVSTAGPWATARVALYSRRAPSKPEMTSDDLFVHTHGRWVDTAVDGKDREPPDRVLKDLGFDTGGGPSTAGVVIFALLVFFVVVGVARLLGGGGTRPPPVSYMPPTNASTTKPPTPARYEPIPAGPRKVNKPCPHCHGTGKEPRGSCGHCHGTGWKPNPSSTPGGPTILPCDCMNKVCTGPCHGSGQIEVEEAGY
jgi:hypothetical protein